MRYRRHSLTLLNLISLALAMLVAVPVLAVGINIFAGGTGDTWRHLLDTVLADYVVNSLILCLGVGICVGLLGTGAAWLVTHYEFRGRQLAQWALLLPMAMPAYVLAYTYTDFFTVCRAGAERFARGFRVAQSRLLVS